MENPDLRKKLRVDRIRKLTMGNGSVHSGATQSVVEDPNQPDWKKFKSLQEIDMIRQTKKDLILSQVISGYLTDSKKVAVTPGDVSFVSMHLQNQTNEKQVYSVTIQDPHQDFLEREEVTLVYSQHELQHWANQGKIRSLNNTRSIASPDTVLLDAGQSVELLFKFQTFREVSHSHLTAASNEIIKQRNVKLVVTLNS
jgi:hypothetical protein